MASDFIGLTVVVTLKLPPGAQVQGLVADVVGQQLTLQDVLFLQTGHRLPEYRIEGAQIADLEIAPAPSAPASQNPAGSVPLPVNHGTHPRTTLNATTQQPKPAAKQSFVDPAILSMGRQPIPPYLVPSSLPPLSNAGIQKDRKSATPRTTSMPIKPQSTEDALDLSTLSGLKLDGDAAALPANETTFVNSGQHQETTNKPSRKRSRRSKRGRPQIEGVLQPQAAELEAKGIQDRTNVMVSGFSENTQKPVPGLIGGVVGQKAVKSLARKERARRAAIEETDGWATEDATGVQGMPEFDFQENLLKFDKRSVFEEIRNGDTTADEDRLVSHNRLPQARPGTAGGKNLHATEMVLERTKTNGTNDWNSEAGETESDTTEAFESGRSSRRAMSRASVRAPSRKGSAIAAASNMIPHIVAQKASKLASTVSSIPGSAPSSKPSLRMIGNNRPCPCVSPLQMLDIEHIATSELGLTEEILTENAARGIAEVGLSILNPGGKRLGSKNHNALPVVVILAGNNKSGARAVAAGRHLRNHGVRVMTCLLGFEREEELLENTRRQLSIFRNIGGKVFRWEDLQSNLKTLDAPPELIIDGLLGMHVAFEDLRMDDQAVAFDLIRWANKSKAPVLSVNLPTGIDGSTGELSSFDSNVLYIRPKFIVSMGAPKIGLLNALIAGEGPDWQLTVVDIGISNTAWRKYGTRRRHGVEFASEWVVGLRYQSGVE